MNTVMDKFHDDLPEAELAILDSELEENSSSISEFWTTDEKELKCLVENNTNLNTKCSMSTWLKWYEKWVEHKADLAKVHQERLDGVLRRFYAELVKNDGKERVSNSWK